MTKPTVLCKLSLIVCNGVPFAAETAGELILNQCGASHMSNSSSGSGSPPRKGGQGGTNDTELPGCSGLFSFQGRIGRMSYFLITLGASAVGAAFLLVPMDWPFSLLLLALFVIVKVIWLSLAASVKRCHDIGHTGWISLLFYVPFVNFLFVGYLVIIPGDEGPNKYGPAPGPPPEQA